MQRLKKRRLGRDSKANIAVEFALISVLFLLPLLAVAADSVSLLNARAQLNTTLEAFMYYALANNANAIANVGVTSGSTVGEVVLLTAINSATTFRVTYSSSTLYYNCVGSTGYQNTALTPYASGSTPCTNGTYPTLARFIQYNLSTTVVLPVPVPLKIVNPVTLRVTGYAAVN
jgi:Flp pilus assembly protein TadG